MKNGMTGLIEMGETSNRINSCKPRTLRVYNPLYALFTNLSTKPGQDHTLCFQRQLSLNVNVRFWPIPDAQGRVLIFSILYQRVLVLPRFCGQVCKE